MEAGNFAPTYLRECQPQRYIAVCKELHLLSVSPFFLLDAGPRGNQRLVFLFLPAGKMSSRRLSLHVAKKKWLLGKQLLKTAL